MHFLLVFNFILHVLKSRQEGFEFVVESVLCKGWGQCLRYSVGMFEKCLRVLHTEFTLWRGSLKNEADKLLQEQSR